MTAREPRAERRSRRTPPERERPERDLAAERQRARERAAEETLPRKSGPGKGSAAR